jgi:hypothetical protein
MEFSQQQARELVNIEEGTFVYWAKLMPRLRQLKGKGRRFKLADVLALGVLSVAVRELGCNIAHLAPSADALFGICHSMSIDEASKKILLFNSSGRCEARTEMPLDRELGVGAIVVRLALVVERMTNQVESDQYRLPLN